MKHLWLNTILPTGGTEPLLVHIDDIRQVRRYDRIMASGPTPTTCIIHWNGSSIWVAENLEVVYERIKAIQIP